MYGHTIDFFFAFVKGKVGDYETQDEETLDIRL